METKKLTDDLKLNFENKIVEVTEQFGDDIIVINKDALLGIARFLKEKPYDFAMLLDLTCVDYQGRDPRFEMVYHFFSLSQNKRLRIKVPLSESKLTISSLTPLWKNANWLEREVYDMFGVHFEGHPDLRRLFMYDEFEGYPLRKDYPLRKRQPIFHMRNEE
ncbi:MAG: NADH-quinone oxidoreductase subunit C [Candidatus Aminicenantes bacterium]|nr:NADH-quinone oxidoreductase subunit C [Candidatus Aminicenantes bacterium]